MARQTLTCSSCHTKFPREEIIFYGSAKNPIKYCPQCYSDRIDRDKFTNYICELFGIRVPGPKIYTQRKALKEKYGFTTDTIIQTLEYLYRVKKLDRTYESIGLVNPQTVEEAKNYYKQKALIYEKLKKAEETKVKDLITPIQKKERKVDLLDIDEYLED